MGFGVFSLLHFLFAVNVHKDSVKGPKEEASLAGNPHYLHPPLP